MTKIKRQQGVRLGSFYLSQQLILIGTFIFGWLLVATPLSLSMEFQKQFDDLPEPKDIEKQRIYIFSIPAFFLGYVLIAVVIHARERFSTIWKSLKVSLVVSPTLYGISYVLTLWLLFVINTGFTFNPFDRPGMFLFVWAIGSLGGISLETFKEVTLMYSMRKTEDIKRELTEAKRELEEIKFRLDAGQRS